MNFIDKIRIKRNPNIIDSLSLDKLKDDMVQYAIKCGYQFNPSTMEKLIGIQAYRENFKNQDEVFQYMKQITLNQQDTDAKNNFYNLYSNNRTRIEEYISIIKSDSELSESFIKELEDWSDSIRRIEIKHIIQIIDGKDELLDEALENHLDMLKSKSTFKEFAEYVASNKTPQELYDMDIKDTVIEQAFIATANPQNYLELFENFDKNSFEQHQHEFISSITDNIEQFIPYLDKLDEVYQSQMSKSFFTDEIKKKVMEYLKENNVLYSENVPKFALEDDEYVLQCIRTRSINFTKNN